MRRILALGCCALYLAFGVVAGAAHVHAAADHHHEMRGLHLDHVHVGEAADHGPGGHHEVERSGAAGTLVDARHVAHHGDDTLYLGIAAHRPLDAGPRVMPATIATAVTLEAPSVVSLRRERASDPLRGPPPPGPAPARAPPA